MPPKTIHKAEYQTVLELLREIRTKAGLTQADLSQALERSQSYVSDVERGLRRLDILQLRDYCKACNMRLSAFIRQLESRID